MTMHTVTYHNKQTGDVLRLLLTDAEFQTGLHRAQENAGDVSPAPPSPIREIVGDACRPDDLLNPNIPDPLNG